MDKHDLIDYWHETSDKDYQTMLNLFSSSDFHWSLFMGHLVIEKLVKAIYVKNVAINPPRTHDLLRLAEKAELSLSEEQQDILDLITTFNINARYPDYNQMFYLKCTAEFTSEKIAKIKEFRTWLKTILEKK
jgi:HEPN domain-containing protein